MQTMLWQGSDLGAYLPHDYVAPYGGRLVPTDFVPRPAGDGWQATVPGAGTTYAVVVGADRLAELHVDGRSVAHLSATTKEQHARGPVVAVLDAALCLDADAAAQERGDAWAGDDLETVGRRLRYEVVAYDEQEQAASNFLTPGDLGAWLAQVSSTSPVTLEVVALTDDVAARDELRDTVWIGDVHWHPEDGQSLPLAQLGDADFELEVLGTVSDGEAGQSSVSLAMSGRSATHAQTSGSVSWEGVLPYVRDSAEASQDPWWVVRIQGTDLAVLVRPQTDNVIVALDRDGADFRLEVVPRVQRTRWHEANERYRRVWGRFLDPHVELSDTEVAHGIERAEAEFHDWYWKDHS